MNNHFCVFILTHGRPDNVITYKTLRKLGYTGEIRLVIDSTDKTADKYKGIYGDQVVVFDKKEAALKTDSGINNGSLNSVLFARNACFDIAKDLGFSFFLQLDDDYSVFSFRFRKDTSYYDKTLRSLDSVFDTILRFYIQTPSITAVAISQGGDFIGGGDSSNGQSIKLLRKAMNSFFCSVDRRFSFFGILNDDVNTYSKLGNMGKLFFTINQVSLGQAATQQQEGGLTELYLENGTYVKSFFSIMYLPSAVKISVLNGQKYSRIHHHITWKNAVPKILDENFRK